jgi:hypothetical protein
MLLPARDGLASMNGAAAPAGWYPDPSWAHEARYFDGAGWTDHVSDRGIARDAPLGPTPPGLIAWFPPEIMMRRAAATSSFSDVPSGARHEAAVAEVSRANTMRVLSIVVAVLLWFPLGIFCGIAGARRSKRAVAAAEAGDLFMATRLLKQVRMLLIVAVVATAVFGVAYTSFMVTRGN